MGLRMLAFVAALALPAANAAAQNPFIEAARGAAQPAPAEPTVVVRAFVEGCIAHEGESMKTVDWAINQGWEPVDAHVGSGATLLSGRAGTVFAWPGRGVLLAIDLDKRCTVWADRAEGPAVRLELARALGALAAKGARVQTLQERSVERAGAWRMQVQTRFRRVGGAQDFEVGSVTTLTEQPTAQVLSAAPMPSRLDSPATDPTGLQRR